MDKWDFFGKKTSLYCIHVHVNKFFAEACRSPAEFQSAVLSEDSTVQ